jgi:uncharacterized protein YcbK (DUF882 family)
MRLSVNFTSEEFACNCGCGFDSIHQAIVDNLQKMRYELKVPIRINSGCRCAKHNAEVGGAPNSFHVLGRAADISAPGISLTSLYEAAKMSGFNGVGLGSNFLHVDNRTDSLTWHYDANNHPVYV